MARSHDEMSDELPSARTLLAKVAREHARKRQKMGDIFDGIVEHFRKADIFDDDVEDIANDDLGDVSIGLPGPTDEDSGSETMSDE